jgi:hypothetical protein
VLLVVANPAVVTASSTESRGGGKVRMEAVAELAGGELGGRRLAAEIWGGGRRIEAGAFYRQRLGFSWPLILK